MKYEPKILFNPKSTVVEFMCNHIPYIFKPGEKRNLDGFVAYHALKETNTGLKEYEAGDEKTVSFSGVAYDKMPWKRVVSWASQRGLYKPGMTRKETVKALEEADEPTGTI